jgi:PKD repeat protein
VIDWGDGDQTRLGAISGSTVVPHTYTNPGSYTVRATATDVAGGRQTVSNSISVGALAVTLSASNSTPFVGTPVNFTATVPAGTQVESYTWVFSDGITQTTTGNTLQRVFTSRGQKVVRVDVTTVSGATGTATTIINVQ